MATKKKVTPKKSAPSKKAAPKKKSAAKKKSAPKNQQIIQSKSLETSSSFNDVEEEESNPTFPPVYTPTGSNELEKEEESSSPMLKYLIIAAIFLVGIIAYSMMKKKDTTAPPEKLEETKASTPTESKVEVKDEATQPTVDAVKEPEPTKTDSATAPALKGYAVAQMVADKTFAEANEHCNSISMSLPSASDLRAIKSEAIPKELKSSVVWTKEQLRFLFSTGKALNIKAGDKFQVLCKE
jgi:hypothetical protein